MRQAEGFGTNEGKGPHLLGKTLDGGDAALAGRVVMIQGDGKGESAADAVQAVGEGESVFHGHGGAQAGMGLEGVGGVTEENGAAADPVFEAHAGEIGGGNVGAGDVVEGAGE